MATCDNPKVTSAQIVDREFLELRAKILELAASFDRIDRALGDVDADPRMAKLGEALQVLSLAHQRTDRAEQVQLIFSLPYDSSWSQEFQLKIKR